MDASKARIGDRFTLATLTQDQANTEGFTATEPKGPTIDATLVGVVASSDQLSDPNPAAYFPSSVLAAGDIGVSATISAVGLRDGATQADLQRDLEIFGSEVSWDVQKAEFVSSDIRAAVDAKAKGLWAIAGISAVAALVVLGQVMTRRVLLSLDDADRLSALGLTHRQRVAEMLGRAAVPIVAGVAVASVLATLPSSWFPTGFVGLLEPDPGFRVEWGVLPLGAVVAAVALLGWVAVGVSVRRRRGRVAGEPCGELVRLAFPWFCAPDGHPVRIRPGGRDAGGVRSGMVGLGVAMVCLVGALTFGASLEQLVTLAGAVG